MIHVENLTKYYGDYAAVRNVSFDVARGQVVGFLGPNGAGKSTTMRILTGYLTATSGKASIDGKDVFWDPIEARKRIGYLPESNPLYSEMRVESTASAAGSGMTARRTSARHVVEHAGSATSAASSSARRRGRRRAGHALIGNPPVLILDEPTVGLDPSQIRETRKLIKELGKEHTLLLSTHILPEVEMTCDSMIIIHQGKVAAQGTLDEVRKQHKGKTLEDVFVQITGAVD